ncbi:unnamed protein product [Bursaphelenchus xylophilus]|uniref:(pine wood nematode) hypothetical protein n=1 Tax=Bursaphelenchus xylophilus TaxID=6326 RepID=A0A1I7S4S6_BURXY|nr:unnamed protein product [Bursaphelenchus xylophilus]CAG9117346.1 unnamed protein product [Bursaphelenchus xylophilus]
MDQKEESERPEGIRHVPLDGPMKEARNGCRLASPKLPRLPFGKQHQVNKFYKQQCDLLENYENDSRQIYDNRQRRSVRLQPAEAQEQQQRLAQCSDQPDDNPETHLLNEDELVLCEQPDGCRDETHRRSLTNNSRRVHPVPRINLCSSQDDLPAANSPEDEGKSNRKRAHYLAIITLLVNITLVLAKGTASYLSGSLSILSSLVDSLVDITSGLVIWLTSRAIRKHDPYLYPVGRTRLEPVALVIVSVVMAVASVQMIVESTESMINNSMHPHVDLPTIGIMIATIIVKFILFLVCRTQSDPSSQVLAMDHRNDCFSNTAALLCAFGAQQWWIYLDPIGAIAVAIYIATTWFMTGREQLIRLSGKTAEPDFINRVIKVCIDHDYRIDYIDTVYVYHFGTRFLVEVHIVLDENMRLKEAHDIAESLQNAIESLEEVERAFVHVDYEFEHKATDEHKIPEP